MIRLTLFKKSAQSTLVVALLLSGLLLAAFAELKVALADTIVTNCSSYGATGGLQVAIAGGGTVTFQCSGTIIVPQINVSTTLSLNGNGNAVTLSGNNANRVFNVTSGGNLTIRGLTVANGYVKSPDNKSGVDVEGGGIYVNGGALNLINTTVTNNQAVGGNATGNGVITFGGDALGGGLLVRSGTLSVLNSTIANNKTIGGNASGGTDIIGGGSGDGGGIYLDSNSNATLTNTTIASNQAIGGNAGSSPTDNSSGGWGGNAGMEVGRSTATLLNVTIVNNQSSSGAGVNHRGGSGVAGLGVYTNASVTLTNSLIAKNVTTDSAVPDISNSFNSISWQGYNLIGNTNGAKFTGDATNLTNLDPLLDAAGLKDNGGPTFTVGLQAGSPALDRILVANCPTTDQRYASRSGLCDIGAFELNGSLPQVVLNPTSLPDGTLNQAYNQTFSATGGTTPYNFYLSSGTLPDGLTLSSAGLLSGTPAASGSFSFTVKVIDNNNFTATRNYTLMVIAGDTVAPTASPIQTPVANVNGWNNTDVIVNWNWKDNAGGMDIDPANCTTSSTSSGEGVLTLSATCKDLAGNTGSASFTVKVDKTAPTVTATPARAANGNGWYNASITFSFSGVDNIGGSGVASCDAAKTYSSPDSATASVTGNCTDAAGNAGLATANFKYDGTKPTVTYTGNAGTYSVDQTVNITCTAADNLSGVASTTCANISGPAYSFAVGNNSFSATAMDKAGNTGNGSTSFTVGVTFDSLCTLSANFSTDPAVDKGLCDKLAAAKAAAAAGDTKTKNNNLNAYRQQLSAQSGKALTKQQATILTNLSKTL